MAHPEIAKASNMYDRVMTSIRSHALLAVAVAFLLGLGNGVVIAADCLRYTVALIEGENAAIDAAALGDGIKTTIRAARNAVPVPWFVSVVKSLKGTPARRPDMK